MYELTDDEIFFENLAVGREEKLKELALEKELNDNKKPENISNNQISEIAQKKENLTNVYLSNHENNLCIVCYGHISFHMFSNNEDINCSNSFKLMNMRSLNNEDEYSESLKCYKYFNNIVEIKYVDINKVVTNYEYLGFLNSIREYHKLLHIYKTALDYKKIPIHISMKGNLIDLWHDRDSDDESGLTNLNDYLDIVIKNLRSKNPEQLQCYSLDETFGFGISDNWKTFIGYTYANEEKF